MDDPVTGRVKSVGWWTAALVSSLGAGALVVLVLGVLDRRGDPLYSIETYQVILASAAAITATASLAGLLLVRRYDLTALAAMASALLIAGFAALMTIGILLLLLAVVPIWLLTKRLTNGSDWPAVLTGAGLGVGMLLLTWVAIQPPLVACGEAGATVSIPSRYSTVAGGATSDGAREVGWAEFDGNTLSYECQGDELVRFELMMEPD